MTVRVLALDLATRTGVCCDSLAHDNVPAFRTWELSGVGGIGIYAPRFHDLRNRLHGLIHEAQVAVVAFEEPLNVMRKMTRGSKPMNNNTTRFLIGLSAIVDECCYANGVKTYEVSVSTAKAHFGGRTTDADPKAAVFARCVQLGWPVKNTDESDAGAIWSFVKCKLDQKFSYRTTPLFGRRA